MAILMKIIDLTHTFTSSMPVFPGDAPAALERLADPEPEVAHFHLDSGLHVGTHMDAPLHMIPNGKKLSEYPPEKFIANGHLIDAEEPEKSPRGQSAKTPPISFLLPP